MADQTLTIQVKADVANATKRFNTVKSEMRGLTGGSEQLGAGIKGVEQSLNSIRGISKFNLFSGLAKDFKALKVSTKSATKDIENFKKKLVIGDTFKDIIGSGLASGKIKPNDLLPESFKNAFKNTIGDTFGEAYEKLDKMNSAMDETIQEFEGLAIRGNELRGMIKDLYKKFAPIITVLLTITGLIKMIKKSISVAAIGDQILDESRKLHLNTVAYQEWGYVLKQNGIQMSSLKQAMRQFSNNVATDAAKLKKYEITGENINDMFSEAVKHIQGLETETEKVAAMTDLFGTRAAELMPIMNMDSKETAKLMKTYQLLGATMSDDLVRKSDELTDSITEMKAAFTGLGNTLGSVFMPMLIKVVQTISLIVGKITILLKAIFGVSETFEGVDKASGSLAEDMSSAVGSAKKLKMLIAGFDELNILPSQDSGGADGLDLGDYDSIASDFGFTDGLADNLEKFKKKVEDNIEWIRDVALGLAALLTSKILGGIIEKLFDITVPLKSILGMALSIVGAFYLVKNAVDAWKNGLNLDNLMGMLLSIIPLVVGLAIAFGPVGAAIGLIIGGITLLIIGFHEFAKTGQVSRETAIAIIAGFALIGGAIALLTGSWIPLLIGVVGVLVVHIMKHWDTIKEQTLEMITNLKNSFKAFLDFVKQLFAVDWTKYFGLAGEIVNALRDQILAVVNGIKGIFDGFIMFIKGVFTGNWRQAWEGVKKVFKSIFDAFVNIAKAPLNAVIRMINKVIGGINKIKLPDWDILGELGGAHFNIPKIPTLAKGGVLTTPTMAVMGEYAGAHNNPEIVTPEKLLTEIIQNNNGELVSAFIQVGRQIVSAIEDKDLDVSFSDADVLQSVRRGNNAYKKQTGKSAFA